MKCLTVRQPWAWAIFHAGKDIENRPWPTYTRGRIAIHAAKGMTNREYREAREYMQRRGVVVPVPEVFLRGFVLGTVELVDCITNSDSEWFEGDYGFVLRNPQRFPLPRPATGALGFWEWQP